MVKASIARYSGKLLLALSSLSLSVFAATLALPKQGLAPGPQAGPVSLGSEWIKARVEHSLNLKNAVSAENLSAHTYPTAGHNPAVHELEP